MIDHNKKHTIEANTPRYMRLRYTAGIANALKLMPFSSVNRKGKADNNP